jgi:uncharacterized protein YlzI (FlbEa/FlbD family)
MIELQLSTGGTVLLNPNRIEAIIRSKYGNFDVLMSSGVVYSVTEDPDEVHGKIKSVTAERLEQEASVSTRPPTKEAVVP